MKNDAAKEIAPYLPPRLQSAFLAINHDILSKTEELRVSAEKPFVIFSGAPYFIDKDGNVAGIENALTVTKEDIKMLVQAICDNSVYSVQPQLCAGFVTLRGGHRAGVTGRAVTEGGRVTHMTDISSVNIRFAREVIGAADALIPYIADKDSAKNTLIISPPGCGKTTILRDVARTLGGSRFLYKTAIADERSELAACRYGVPTNDVGALTAVLEGCPKAEGMLMLLRSMSPEVIITDEIGTDEDVRALFQIINAGVKVICSAHGYDREDVCRRPAIKHLLDGGVYETVAVLSRRSGPGTIEKIYS